MNTLTRTLIVAALVPVLGNFAFAQSSLRRFDDLAFSALNAARDLRWEIHDEFDRSRDQRALLQDVEGLITDLHQIQKMIYQRRSPRELDRELDHAIEHAAELRNHLLSSDFAMQRGGSFHFSANGYVFQPETRHAGRVHVDHALSMLAGIEVNLNQLHRELTGTPSPTAIPVKPIPKSPVGFPSGSVKKGVSDKKPGSFSIRF